MNLKSAGVALLCGGLLLILRIGPVVAAKPEAVAFPPQTTAELVQLADAAGSAWPVAHVLGLIAVALLLFGYVRHGGVTARAGHGNAGRAAAAIAAIALGLFSCALVIDGFIVYSHAEASAADPANPDLLAAVAVSHSLALAFFTPALFALFIAIGVLSFLMLRGFIHYRWLGAIGMLIAVAAITLYLTGLAGPNWDNMQTGGLVTMAGFVWHILLGLVAIWGVGVREKNCETN